MLRKRDQDLFQETSMTFGEHLEELRTCLFKSLAGLAIGFVIGLFIGQHVVKFIEMPLRNSLVTFYQEQALEEIQANVAKLREAGYPLPDDAATLTKLYNNGKMVLPDGMPLNTLEYEKVYVSPLELLHRLKQTAPEQFQGVDLPDDIPDAATLGEAKIDIDLVPIYMWRPTEDAVRVTSLNVQEPFLIYIKASLVVGALLASPWIFYQIWFFVASGLYRHERKYIHIYLPFSLALFFAGAGLAFFVVFGYVLKFLFMFNGMLGIEQDIRITEWMSFVLMLPLGFGISFQLPLVMLFLERIGIFDVSIYLAKWRMAILVIAVLSMLLTPSDPQSMLLMLLPLTILYFGGILLCKVMPRRKSPFDELDGKDA